MTKLILLFCALIFLLCEKSKDNEIVYQYQKPVNNLSGCCSHHGGIQTCALPDGYVFTDDARVVCVDNSIPPMCLGVYQSLNITDLESCG